MDPLQSHRPTPFRDHPADLEPVWLRGFCSKVVDGDTYDLLLEGRPDHILSNERVRLAGVDTPEVYGAKATPDGRVAKARVEDLILGQPVMALVGSDRDKYGRLVVEVEYFAIDGLTSLGGTLLAEGLGTPFLG